MKKMVCLSEKCLLIIIIVFSTFTRVFGQKDSIQVNLVENPNVEHYSSKKPFLDEFIQLRVGYSMKKYDVIITKIGQTTNIVHLEIEDTLVKQSFFNYGSYLPDSEENFVMSDFKQSLILGFFQYQIYPLTLHSDFVDIQIFDSDKLIFRVLIDGVNNSYKSGSNCKLVDDLLKLSFKKCPSE